MKRFLTVSLLSISLGSINLWAQEKSNLIENSPFIPFGTKEQPGPAAPQGRTSIEFRGVVDLGDGPQFSVFDSKAKKSYWLKQDDPESQFKVQSYDPKTQTLELMLNGTPSSITLKKASETSSNEQATNRPAPKPSPLPAFDPKSPVPRELVGGTTEDDKDKRQEMANKVFGAFKKYVEQRKAAAEAARNR